jgi:uncharacterized membrane protein YvbJ
VPTCPRCGGDVAEGAARCEHCGHLLAAAAPPPASTAQEPAGARRIAGIGCGLLTVMLILVSIVVVFGALMGGLLGLAGVRAS